MRKFFLYTILLVNFLIFSPLLFGFFQQDEWLVFSHYFLIEKENLFVVLKGFFTPNPGHYVPLTQIFSFLEFLTFKFNYTAYALLSLILNLLVIGLFYKFTELLFKSQKLTFIATLLFAFNSVGIQATMWPFTNINTHGATIFGLLSLIYFLKFLNQNLKKDFILFVVFLLISLLFKEITIGMFPFVFSIYLLYKKNSYSILDKFRKDRFLQAIFFVGFLYLSFRIILIFLPQTSENASVITETQGLPLIVYNFLTFPFKGVVQSIVPLNILLEFSKFITLFLPNNITGVNNSFEFNNFVLKRTLEAVNIISFGLVVGFLFVVWKKLNEDYRFALIFGFLFIIFNSLVLSLSPERSGIISVIDSRNLFYLTIGSSIVLTIFFSLISKKNILVLGLILFIVINLFNINLSLNDLLDKSYIRKSILYKIKNEYPDIDQKVVFYVESDTSYYGLDDKIVPFQSGFGQTLLMWYQPTENFPDEFLVSNFGTDRFLWDIRDQDYRQVEDRGFGYFRDYDRFVEEIKSNNININSIYGFSWKGRTNTLINITDDLRNRLKSGE